MTNQELLKAWDEDKPVWLVSMGGLGPAYEQCIQLMAMEILRVFTRDGRDFKTEFEGEEGQEEWVKYARQVEDEPAVKDIMEKLGPTGAQWYAALNEAAVLHRNGYEKGMEMIEEDRKIQVTKSFPSVL